MKNLPTPFIKTRSDPAVLPPESKDLTIGGLPALTDEVDVKRVHDLILGIYWRIQNLREEYAYNRSQGFMFTERSDQPPINYQLDLLTNQAQELRDFYGI